jgi:hypothetical protein
VPAARRHPDQEPPALFAEVRQRRAIDPLCAKHIDIVKFGKLLRRERLSWAKRHMPGVVNDNIETAVVLDDLRDGSFSRIFRGNV